MATKSEKIRLISVNFVPSEESTLDDPGPQPCIQIKGSCPQEKPGLHRRQFRCNLFMELDGRDCDYEQISGPYLGADESDLWDSLLEALNKHDGFLALWKQLSSAYLG